MKYTSRGVIDTNNAGFLGKGKGGKGGGAVWIPRWLLLASKTEGYIMHQITVCILMAFWSPWASCLMGLSPRRSECVVCVCLCVFVFVCVCVCVPGIEGHL